MSKATMAIAVLLMVLGATVFAMAGADDPELLIPAFFGVLLVLCEWMSLSRTRRVVWLPIAEIIGVVGTIFPLVRGLQAIVKAYTENDELAQPFAVMEELVMAGLCLIVTIVCVRRFHAASKAA